MLFPSTKKLFCLWKGRECCLWWFLPCKIAPIPTFTLNLFWRATGRGEDSKIETHRRYIGEIRILSHRTNNFYITPHQVEWFPTVMWNLVSAIMMWKTPDSLWWDGREQFQIATENCTLGLYHNHNFVHLLCTMEMNCLSPKYIFILNTYICKGKCSTDFDKMCTSNSFLFSVMTLISTLSSEWISQRFFVLCNTFNFVLLHIALCAIVLQRTEHFFKQKDEASKEQ